MPEGHTIHRLARRHNSLFAGHELRQSSPQGRFAASAAHLSGVRFDRVDAYGKHLFYRFAGGRVVHVHLGLYGSFVDGPQPAPEPRGALRWRIEHDDAYADLRGPTACELVDDDAVDRVLARLGPDPLRREASPDEVWRRLSRRSIPVGAALMDQAVLAGVGNVYRAEALHVNGISPLRPAASLSRAEFDALWSTVVTMLKAGVRAGRIVTTVPSDRSRRSGPARVEDAHYVYRRTDLPCRRCGAAIVSSTIAARTAYWCPVCQPGG
jgi:DNA-formamidopyrimidine glycosylase